MRFRLSLALAATLLLPAAGAAHPAPGDGTVLAVRYAFVVGGRGEASVPPGAGVLSQPELADFLSGWNPDKDYDEVRRVFALNDLGEVARQAVLLPADGGELSGRFSYRGAALELRLRVHPATAGVRVAAEIDRDGALVSAPSTFLSLGERAILSSATKEPDLPFVFVVLEIEQTERARVVEQGLPATWSGRAPRVDGVVVLPPKLVDAPRPAYPEEARKAKTQGMVVVDALIDERGAVQEVRLVRGQPDGLSEAAMEAVRKWRFEPATLDGSPVAVEYSLTVRFRLE